MAKRKSRILDEMHQTASGLHNAGLLSKQRIGEFEALCELDAHQLSLQKNAEAGSGRQAAEQPRE